MRQHTSDTCDVTVLERLAMWTLWVTIWGPIVTVLASFQSGVAYSYYSGYRYVVFICLVVQICSLLAVRSGAKWGRVGALVVLAALHNPVHVVHLGSAWPWRVVNVATLLVSGWAIAGLRSEGETASAKPSVTDAPPPEIGTPAV